MYACAIDWDWERDYMCIAEWVMYTDLDFTNFAQLELSYTSLQDPSLLYYIGTKIRFFTSISVSNRCTFTVTF